MLQAVFSLLIMHLVDGSSFVGVYIFMLWPGCEVLDFLPCTSTAVVFALFMVHFFIELMDEC